MPLIITSPRNLCVLPKLHRFPACPPGRRRKRLPRRPRRRRQPMPVITVAGNTVMPTLILQVTQVQSPYNKVLYSKISRYAASRNADLANTRFSNGSQTIRETQVLCGFSPILLKFLQYAAFASIFCVFFRPHAVRFHHTLFFRHQSNSRPCCTHFVKQNMRFELVLAGWAVWGSIFINYNSVPAWTCMLCIAQIKMGQGRT